MPAPKASHHNHLQTRFRGDVFERKEKKREIEMEGEGDKHKTLGTEVVNKESEHNGAHVRLPSRQPNEKITDGRLHWPASDVIVSPDSYALARITRASRTSQESEGDEEEERRG